MLSCNGLRLTDFTGSIRRWKRPVAAVSDLHAFLTSDVELFLSVAHRFDLFFAGNGFFSGRKLYVRIERSHRSGSLDS